MQPVETEKAKCDSNCDVILGISSWDKSRCSVKYAWKDKNGKRTRGGEFPVEALPQMVRMALEYGYIKPKDLFKD